MKEVQKCTSFLFGIYNFFINTTDYSWIDLRHMPIFRGKEVVSAVADYKDSVRAATRSNIDLTSMIYSIDDVVLKHRDRILITGQSNLTENGIYVWNSITSRLVRAPDADSSYELSAGVKVYVEEGTLNSQTNFVLVTPGEITLGQTELSFLKENRIGGFDKSGLWGSSNKTLILSLDQSGQITSIDAADIDLDGGNF